jgi:hypothetical protein
VLVLPAEHLSRVVECPQCQHAFLAAAAVAPVVGIKTGAPPLPRRDAEFIEEENEHAAPGPVFDDIDGPRRDHRGDTIAWLGVTALFLSWLPVVSHALALRALWLAHNDLKEMHVLVRDDTRFARMFIRIGQVCGGLALVLSTAALVAFALYRK